MAGVQTHTINKRVLSEKLRVRDTIVLGDFVAIVPRSNCVVNTAAVPSTPPWSAGHIGSCCKGDKDFEQPHPVQLILIAVKKRDPPGMEKEERR